ncbi:MAG: hypothetical protein ACK5QT_09745 [Oligoflexia bacterium]
MSDQSSFIPIDDLQAGLKLVRDACRAQTAAKIWVKDHGIISKTRLLAFDFNQDRFSVAINEDLDIAALNEGISRDSSVYLNFETQGLSLFVKAEFIGLSIPAAKIELRLPSKIFRTQQRKHPRAVVRDRSDVQIVHADPVQPNRVLTRKLNDLSVGGASMILFYGEERHYHVRQRLESIELKIKDQVIHTWGIVRHLAVFPQDSEVQGIKLGIEFFNLGPTDQKIISDLVDSEIRHQFEGLQIES